LVKKKPGHIPERTCISCGRKGERSSFFRVVRTKEGNVLFADDEKIHGRSAYICRREECLKLAGKKIERALKISIDPSQRKDLFEKLMQAVRVQGEDE
jgi:hypothetical protein